MKESERENIEIQYSNREQTNIIVVTLTTSFSFTLLGIFISQVLFQEPFNFGMAYTLIIVGLIFTLIGVLYREVSTFLLGLYDLKLIMRHYQSLENFKEVIGLPVHSRGVLRILFYFPFGLWVGILSRLGYSLPTEYMIVVIALAVGIPTAILTGIENFMYKRLLTSVKP